MREGETMLPDTEQMIDVWKKQLDASLRAVDALVEGSARMRATQLAAAKETHERAIEMERSVAGATTAFDLWTLQWNWALGNCEKSVGYWRSLFEAATETNGRICGCALEQMQASGVEPGGVFERLMAGPSVQGDSPLDPAKAALAAVDTAYSAMLKTSQQMFEFTANAFTAAARAGATAQAAIKADAKKAA